MFFRVNFLRYFKLISMVMKLDVKTWVFLHKFSLTLNTTVSSSNGWQWNFRKKIGVLGYFSITMDVDMRMPLQIYTRNHYHYYHLVPLTKRAVIVTTINEWSFYYEKIFLLSKCYFLIVLLWFQLPTLLFIVSGNELWP